MVKSIKLIPRRGGHAEFAPGDQLEFDLLLYLQRRLGRVSVERVCSGQGIPHIYAYLKQAGYADEPSWLSDQLSRSTDHTPIIVNAGLDNQRECKLCVATLKTFSSILGREAGNVALRFLSTGGVYLGGGIPSRILKSLKGGDFLRTFTAKGRLSALLEQVPVYVILNRKAAIIGAASHGFRLSKQDRG